MGRLEDTLARAVEEGTVPHVVVFATNGDATFTYKHSVGYNKLGESKPIPEDAVFQLASQTKMLTSIAALQVVDKGLFGLDDDVAGVLPEVAKQPILKGFDVEDKPIFEERKKVMTLRQMLTHSSGLAYDAGVPDIAKFKTQKGIVPATGISVSERFEYPLIFEPGAAWMYGCGIDWVGKLVERVSGKGLDEFVRENISEPLGIKTISFFPHLRSELTSKVPGMTVRMPDGKLGEHDKPLFDFGYEDAFGGFGAYSNMEDFLKVQRSLLANDGKLLKPETVEMMFTPQLSPEAKKSLNEFLLNPLATMLIGENDPKIEVDWGLAGMLFLQDDAGRRKKGTLNWGGMPNTFWIIDREADLALAFATQVLPPGDDAVSKLITQVELAVYEMAGVRF